MKKFTINCDFSGQIAPFAIYIGQPEQNHHPLHFQAEWLSKQRGGTIPAEVMDAVAKLKDLAEKNNVSLEELCVYAIGSAEEDQSLDELGDNSVEDEEDLEELSNDEDAAVEGEQSVEESESADSNHLNKTEEEEDEIEEQTDEEKLPDPKNNS